jgi:hypothetical protein
MGGGITQTSYVLYLDTSNNRTAEVTLFPLNSVSLIGLGEMYKFS